MINVYKNKDEFYIEYINWKVIGVKYFMILLN